LAISLTQQHCEHQFLPVLHFERRSQMKMMPLKNTQPLLYENQICRTFLLSFFEALVCWRLANTQFKDIYSSPLLAKLGKVPEDIYISLIPREY
jgi:hypothetical protein